MDIYQQPKQEVLQLFQSAISLTKTYGNQKFTDRLVKSANYLRNGKLLVVVAGEFKQGKSSLLNALIDERGLFPVDVDITTNLVSTITYGETEKITVLLGEQGKQQEEKQIPREKIADYVTEQGNQKNIRQAKLMIIQSPNAKLKEGLILVDTPGVGGLNIKHTAITYAFIPNADAILFVSDALAPLTETELSFIKIIARQSKNLIFVVTKIDAVENYQAIIESNREKLTQILQCSPEKITIIPVSSQAKLDFLKSQNPEDLEDSNFTVLENELWGTLNQNRGKILLMRSLTDLAQVLADLRMPIEAQWKACGQQTSQVKEMEEQLQQVQTNLKKLLENNANWKMQLGDGITDISNELTYVFQGKFKKIFQKAEKYLEPDIRISNPEQVFNLIQMDINELLTQLETQLNEKAIDLKSKIESETGLNLNPFQIKPLNPALPQKTIDIEALVTPKPSQNKSWINYGTMYTPIINKSVERIIGGLLGTVGGAVLGIIFGGPSGVLGGAVLGGFVGTKLLGEVAFVARGMIQSLAQKQEREQIISNQKLFKQLKHYLPEQSMESLLCSGF